MDVVVTYDIAGTAGSGARRLREVAAVCEEFGTRAQFSVFECRVTPAGLAKLLSKLEDAIDPRRDSVHVYRLPGRLADSRTTLGITKHHEVDEPWLL